jgi:hypothetical protein
MTRTSLTRGSVIADMEFTGMKTLEQAMETSDRAMDRFDTAMESCARASDGAAPGRTASPPRAAEAAQNASSGCLPLADPRSAIVALISMSRSQASRSPQLSAASTSGRQPEQLVQALPLPATQPLSQYSPAGCLPLVDPGDLAQPDLHVGRGALVHPDAAQLVDEPGDAATRMSQPRPARSG